MVLNGWHLRNVFEKKRTDMEIIIDLSDKRKAQDIRTKLQEVSYTENINIRIAKDSKDAQKLCEKHFVDCVIYDRSYTEKLEEYFDSYTYQPTWFVPYSKEQNHIDVIDAINTHRTAYYIVEPVDKLIAESTLRNIRMRIS